jgi:hypothetical protein
VVDVSSSSSSSMMRALFRLFDLVDGLGAAMTSSSASASSLMVMGCWRDDLAGVVEDEVSTVGARLLRDVLDPVMMFSVERS